MLNLRKLLYGSASNVLRLLLSILVAVTVPPLLVRSLTHEVYSAWVLILQMSTYVGLLDLGVQTVVAKLVAEYYAKENRQASHDLLSSAVSMLSLIALVGGGAVFFLVWQVPHLFAQMPQALVLQVRISLLLIGCSAAFALPFNPFLAVFTGLQEYGFPTAVALLSRIGSTLLLVVIVLKGGGLVEMAVALSIVNVSTALAQWTGWRRYAGTRIGYSAFFMDRAMTKRLMRSGGALAVWTMGMLFVSGLDVVVVGHYDYSNTGFYSIGATATNFLLMCVGSLFSPLLPAVSAMQTTSTSKAIGDLAIQTSRFCTIVLLAMAVPLIIGAYPLLFLWVGRTYALHSVRYLRVLVIANVVRQLGYPYATIMIATGQQYLATIAAVAEALVNVVLSIWLVRRIGAIGVAYGTLMGAFVTIGLHLALSMRLTQRSIELSRKQFVLDGLIRPLVCTVPTFLLLPFVKWNSLLPAPAALLGLCALLMSALCLRFGTTQADRISIKARLFSLRNTVAMRT